MANTKSPIDIARETGMSLSQVLAQIGRDTGWGDQYLNTGPIVAGDGNTWLGNGDGTYNVYANDPNANDAPASYNGRAFDKYNGAGEKVGGGTLSGYKNGGLMDYAPFAMLAAGMAPALLGAGAAGASGAAASGGMPASSTAVGSGLSDLGLGNIADAGITGSQFAAPSVMTNMPMTGYLESLLPAAGSVPATSMGFDAAVGGAAGGVLGGAAGAASAAAGGVGAGSAAAGGAGLLGTGITAADALKLGIPLAGALAGAQGVKSETNTSQKTDPRVDPYLFGQGGLLDMTKQQLASAQSPATMAGWDSLKSKGMGLMNQPVAQNGFNLFTKGRY